MLTPALLQLPGARMAASVSVVYLALLESLDYAEYRTAPVARICIVTGYSETAVFDSLNTLVGCGFLDQRGNGMGGVPRKFRLLHSRRPQTQSAHTDQQDDGGSA